MTNDTVVGDFIPTEDWPDVSTMLEGFGRPSLPDSDALSGRTFDVVLEDGQTARYEFHDAARLTRALAGGTGGSSTHRYRAVEVRPSLFFIDFLKGDGVKTHDISIVLDIEGGRVAFADTGFVSRGGEIRTHTDFLSGRIAGTGPIEPLVRTDVLVGKRIYYRYSETEAYEHVYFDGGTVAWHCVKGGEKGLADVEQIKVWELADGIVLYFWTETVMPVDAFLLVDLKHRRSIGRMFCWESSSLDIVHLPFDSQFTVLNETTYPKG